MMRFFFFLILVLTYSVNPSPSFASGGKSTLQFNEYDKQAHVIVAYQFVFLMEHILADRKMEKADAAMVASATGLALAIMKESLIDPRFDFNDLLAGAAGSILATICFAVLPLNSYEIEGEAGLTRFFSPKSGGSSEYTRPPPSTMIDAQSTIWFGRALGLHLFSGGLSKPGAANDNSKRLQFGGGGRLALFSLFKKSKVGFPFLTLWAGADYGFLLFAKDQQAVTYKASKYVPIYSAGLRIAPVSNMELSVRAQQIPYSGRSLYGLNGSLGLVF